MTTWKWRQETVILHFSNSDSTKKFSVNNNRSMEYGIRIPTPRWKLTTFYGIFVATKEKIQYIILVRQHIHVHVHCKQQARDWRKKKSEWTPEKAVTLFGVHWLAQLVPVEASFKCVRYSFPLVFHAFAKCRRPAPTCTLLLNILLWLNQCELTQPPSIHLAT